MIQKERKLQLQEVINSLPEKQREVLRVETCLNFLSVRIDSIDNKKYAITLTLSLNAPEGTIKGNIKEY